MIKDSGNRREFETGAVRDIQEGKGRCDLLPLDVVAKLRNNYKVLVKIDKYQESGDIQPLIEVLDMALNKFPSLEMNILDLSKHFEEGAKKYGENNWQKGIPTHCYIDSAVRHFLKLADGETDERHDRAFAWNIMCCIWTCIHKPELNEYLRSEDNAVIKQV